jgi:hypothetical protein
MLLQVLWTLECLSAEVAFVRLEWDVDADVGGDVVAFHGGRAAGTPLAGEVEVVCALAADMAFADVVLALRVSCVFMLLPSAS